jgi:Mrp family chromosome partitioning ATPase
MKSIIEQLKEMFDYIIVDLPPVNLVSDAISISKYITGMIVVVREDHTEKKELDRCFRQLRMSNVNIIGCVINDAKTGKGSYGRYRRYRYYKYYKYYQTYQSSTQKGDKK